MVDREKKERKTEIEEFQYLENEKNFLDEIKNIFQFFSNYNLVKNKNLIKNNGHKLCLIVDSGMIDITLGIIHLVCSQNFRKN